MNNSYPFYVHLDMNNQQIKSVVIDNVNTFPVIAVPGSVVFNSTLGHFYGYDGLNWLILDQTLSGSITFKGGITFDGTPTAPQIGNQYIFTNSGITTVIAPGSNVEIGDFAFYDGVNWNIINKNVVNSSELIAGIVRLSTSVEVLSGLDNSTAVTPFKLNTWWNNTKPFVDNGITYSSNTIKLGGTLVENTTVNTNTFDLSLGIVKISNVFNINNTQGVLEIRTDVRANGVASDTSLVTEKAVRDLITSATGYAATINLVPNIPLEVTHNLGTKDVTVAFYNSSDLVLLIPYITINTTKITVESTNTLNNVRVVIKK